jgi:hypothetical protein
MLAHGENIANPATGGPQPLPYQKPLRTWASRGTGATCDLCNARIHPHEIEYEVELPADGEKVNAHMHFSCHQRWVSEGRRRAP